MGFLLWAAVGLAVFGLPNVFAAVESMKASERMIGMYVHEHWPYNHSYAAARGA